MESDYYAILEIRPEASVEEIKKAYRSLALRYHPDKNKEPDAHDRFIRINEAYLILSDSEARLKYDSERHARPPMATAYPSEEESSRDWPNFDDADLRDWSNNARRQADRFASMSYTSFAHLIGQIAKETGSQLGNALVFALSAFFGSSAIFTFFFGIAHGDVAQVFLAVIVGAICLLGLAWSGKKYD